MPSKCLKCGKEYENNSPELLYGCDCGARVFIFLKQDEKITDFQYNAAASLNETTSTPIVIKFEAENIAVLKKGSYAMDINSLMKGEPVVVKNLQGVYYLEFPSYKVKK